MMKCHRKIIFFWGYFWIVLILIVSAALVVLDRVSWDHDRQKILAQLDRDRIEKEIGENRLQNLAFDEVYPKNRDKAEPVKNLNAPKSGKPQGPAECEEETKRTEKFHTIWGQTNSFINRDSLYKENTKVDLILKALATAKIVYVDVLDWPQYEKGTSEKWVVTLEGGQKAMMKLDWDPNEFGKMKPEASCNSGFEMPSSEIAAFHLHQVLGFYNSVYVTGRQVNIIKEIMPVASQEVLLQIKQTDSSVCINGHFNIPKDGSGQTCPPDGVIRASLSYWIPRQLKLYTYPPKFMPFSTPNEKSWGIGLNNRTYCESLRKDQHPYEFDWYYRELFDFAVIDTLMHHYDSKHYVIYDKTKTRGLTVRLDHGRAFCSHVEDYEYVMLTPIKQCCTMRRSTYEMLLEFSNKPGELSKKWKEAMMRDPLYPIMDDVWFEVIERRLRKIMDLVKECADKNNGLEHVLVS